MLAKIEKRKQEGKWRRWRKEKYGTRKGEGKESRKGKDR